MKKSSRRSRRHRNPKTKEGDKQASFFPKTSENKVQAKEESSFFQPKLEVAPANDPQEKEADAVANNVVHGVKQQQSAGVQKKEQINRMSDKEKPDAKLQRMAAEEEKPKAKLQRAAEKEKPDAKLQRMAAEEEKPKAKLQRAAEEEKPTAKLQRAAEKEKPDAKLQRMAAEEEKPKAKLQRAAEKEDPAAKHQVHAKEESSQKQSKKNSKKKEATSGLEQMIKKTKGKGFALPNDIKIEMEAQFNVDFSNVRIHTGLLAVEMCEEIRAQAFTHGFDIYFNDGKYNPDTDTGKNLLAHELTHVVQQKGG